MPLSARLKIRSPALTDTADVPRDIQNVANDIDNALIGSTGLLAARPTSTVGTPGIVDRFYFATDDGPSGTLYRDTGTGWVAIGPSIIADGAVTTPKLAAQSVTPIKISGTGTAGYVLRTDGTAAGTAWAQVDAAGIAGGAVGTAQVANALKPSAGAGAGTEALRALGTSAGQAQQGDATLSALAGLDATVGFVIETAADVFTKRSLAGTAGQVTVTNGDGVAGAPTISLPGTITPAVTFSGAITFSNTVTVGSGNNVIFGASRWSKIGASSDRAAIMIGAESFNTSGGMARIILGLGGVGDTHGTIEIEGDSGVVRFGVGGTTVPDVAVARFGTGALQVSGATTQVSRVRFVNNSGDMQVGVESSVGGATFSGTTAYGAIVGPSTNTPLHLVTNATVRATIDAAGRFIHIKGSARPFRTITTSVTLTDADTHVVDTGGGNTITLAAANGVPAGFALHLINFGAADTVQRAGTDNIKIGSSTVTSVVMSIATGPLFLVSDGGSNWYVMNRTT